jgi:hypothetical protein
MPSTPATPMYAGPKTLIGQSVLRDVTCSASSCSKSGALKSLTNNRTVARSVARTTRVNGVCSTEVMTAPGVGYLSPMGKYLVSSQGAGRINKVVDCWSGPGCCQAMREPRELSEVGRSRTPSSARPEGGIGDSSGHAKHAHVTASPHLPPGAGPLPRVDTPSERTGMSTSDIQWIQPAAFIASTVAIVGWFVAYSLRSYETQRDARRATYAKVLGPTAECLSTLRHAREEDRATWLAERRGSFEECLVRLVVAVGEVDLIRKSKVSWAALSLWETLSRGRALSEIESVDKPQDLTLFRTASARLYDDATRARRDFLLIAGRSLESQPARSWRDRRVAGRKARITQISAEVHKARNDQSDSQGWLG